MEAMCSLLSHVDTEEELDDMVQRMLHIGCVTCVLAISSMGRVLARVHLVGAPGCPMWTPKKALPYGLGRVPVKITPPTDDPAPR